MSQTVHESQAEELFQGDERLDQLHRVLLMMLKDFAAFCEAEKLSWIAMYGTAIGALRHGGFIPWDDDLDICMTRAELEAFTTLVNGAPGAPGASLAPSVTGILNSTDPVPEHIAAFREKYSVTTSRTHAGYPLMTYRLMLKGTEFRDSNLATMDFPSEIFLDLFPLDALADDQKARERQIWRSWLYNKLAIAKLTANPYIAGKGLKPAIMRLATNLARGFFNLPGIRSIDTNVYALSWLLKYDGQQTRLIGYPCDTDRNWDIYEIDEIFPVRWVDFEDTRVPIANKAEKLLSDFYGDWQTPPPNELRTAHYPDILDFGDYAHI